MEYSPQICINLKIKHKTSKTSHLVILSQEPTRYLSFLPLPQGTLLEGNLENAIPSYLTFLSLQIPALPQSLRDTAESETEMT